VIEECEKEENHIKLVCDTMFDVFISFPMSAETVDEDVARFLEFVPAPSQARA
jgi:hypothetical protein